MKTKNFLARTSLLIVMILLASCSAKQQEYINVIPADAMLVVSMDMQSLTAKSAVPESDKQQLRRKMTASLENDLDAATLEYVDKILENPEETGLSASDKLYVFMTGPQISVNVVAKVIDIEKLKTAVQMIEKTAPLTEKNGYFETTVEDDVLFAFNDNTLLIASQTGIADIPGGQTSESVAKLMAQDVSASILSNKGFDKLNKQRNDISLYVCMGMLMDLYAAQLPPMQMQMIRQQMPAGIDMNEMFMLTSVNFEQGRIALKMENYTESEKIKAFYEEQKKITGKLNSAFLDCFPASSLLFMSCNLNGEELYKYMQTMPSFAESMKAAGDKVDIQRLIGALNGDFTIGITSLSPQGVPYVTAYAQMKNDYWMQVIKDMQGSMGIPLEPAGENAYVFKSMGLEVYAGMNEDYFYITDDPQVFKSVGAEVADPMSKAVWGANAKKSYSFVLLNVTDILKQPLVAMALSMSGKKDMQALYSILSGCSYVEAFAPDFSNSEMNIVLTNQNENALKQIATGTVKLVESMQ